MKFHTLAVLALVSQTGVDGYKLSAVHKHELEENEQIMSELEALEQELDKEMFNIHTFWGNVKRGIRNARNHVNNAMGGMGF